MTRFGKSRRDQEEGRVLDPQKVSQEEIKSREVELGLT